VDFKVLSPFPHCGGGGGRAVCIRWGGDGLRLSSRRRFSRLVRVSMGRASCGQLADGTLQGGGGGEVKGPESRVALGPGRIERL